VTGDRAVTILRVELRIGPSQASRSLGESHAVAGNDAVATDCRTQEASRRPAVRGLTRTTSTASTWTPATTSAAAHSSWRSPIASRASGAAPDAPSVLPHLPHELHRAGDVGAPGLARADAPLPCRSGRGGGRRRGRLRRGRTRRPERDLNGHCDQPKRHDREHDADEHASATTLDDVQNPIAGLDDALEPGPHCVRGCHRCRAPPTLFAVTSAGDRSHAAALPRVPPPVPWASRAISTVCLRSPPRPAQNEGSTRSG
jgi:hypothetical protein